jgi:predicted ATPase/signal transduction histidine kinase
MTTQNFTLTGYQTLDRIYSGTRTLVYRGFRTRDKQPVAIKVLRSEYPSFSELVQFRNQYTIAKNLNLPGIIETYSLEAYQNSYALVMEDFGGISLQASIQQGETLPNLRDFLQMAIDISNTLDILCRHRIIHKDIKPANILINPQTKQVKLIDFSIASLLPRETQTLINPNVLEGTLGYLSPEQTGRMNRGVDYRTDFYSLGVTFYELLAGELPFQSIDPMELVHCHIAKQPLSLHDIKPEIPQALSEIVSKLMAKNAEDRYQSALGLKFDLELCLSQLQDSGQIGSFAIAQRDLCDRFIIPEKLYGRETEVKTLLEAFERVASPLGKGKQRAIEMILVAGFSGIGKTVVVNEVHKPIVLQRGYFIKGKFDQFNRNIPFSALVQAFRHLMEQLLSESDENLEKWQTQILQALGNNGQVIIEVIPEIEKIIGKQPPALELSGNAAQNRFNLLFQNFIQVFATPEHPLVIFLDDLQWADSASLQLMQLLMSESETGCLLVIGAYRDNEVSPVHPLMLTLGEIAKIGATVNTITLQPLSRSSLNQLVSETLNCPLPLAQPLTELVHQKTQGNPFFATQFLKALHQDESIAFDLSAGHWQCDLVRVREAALTDDVVQFMATQLQKFPAATQEILKLAGCVGNQFDLKTLAIVSEQTEVDAAAALWKALQAGFILPQSEVYKFYVDRETKDEFHNSQAVNYKFLHDRIQQAAYSLIPEDQKQQTHLKIGQLLLQNTPPDALAANIFEIANHLNQGVSLIQSANEKIELVSLNLLAGQKAKASVAYESALNYLNAGLHLLGEESWQEQYKLTLELHVEATEVSFLSTDFERSKQLADVTLQYAKTLLDKIKVHEVEILSHTAQNQNLPALEITLNVLKALDISLEDKAPKNLTIEDCRYLPEMTDPEKLAAMRLLVNAYAPAFMSAPDLFPKLVFTAIKLCLQFGNSAMAAVSYVFYGLVSVIFNGDVESGYRFGELAVYTLDYFDSRPYYCLVHTVFHITLRHWKEPVRETIQPNQKAMNVGLETGDVFYAACASKDTCTNLLLMGEELEVVAQQQVNSIELLHKLKQQYSIYYAGIWYQLVLNLRGFAKNRYRLIGDGFDEDKLLSKLQADQNQALLANFYLAKGILLFLLEDYNNSVICNSLARENIESCGSMITVPTHNFYESLALLAHYHSSNSEQQGYLQQVKANQEKMDYWANHAPPNFRHKYDLVEAERYRVLGNKAEAIELYDRAITGAKENGYIQEEALANELAAKFYLEWGKEKVAAGYMQEAYYCYARWGAKAKIDDLETRYRQLLQPILLQANQPSSILETLAQITTSAHSIHSNTRKTSTSNSLNHTLDFAALLKVSQTLSSTIELDELLQTLTQTMLENSGANRCALMLPQEGKWRVRVMADLEQITLQTVPLENNANLPVKLIQYVKNTLTAIAIDDLDTDLPVIGNYLSQHQPKSVLCLPILDRANLVGILYLENRVTSGVFTGDRILILNFLCTQAAISLENARLYRQAQQMLEDLQQAQLQLVQSEKMSALGNLVAGVAHEINNPVGFINGNIDEATTTINDVINHLRLYQEKLPNPGKEIEQDAEDIDLEYALADLPKMLSSMKVGCDRIRGISTSLRTFSRADKDYKVPFNIHEGIDSTILILKHRLKANEHRPAIEVVTDYGNLPQIECFPGQLNQVFMNLLANAIDALDESDRGRSFAEIENNPNRITIRTMVEGESVKIAIADNGTGMSSEVKSRIFDHLFTTKSVAKGTGLGLAIARQIVVEKHGGAIAVESQSGQGTTFNILIPIETQEK